nr:MAG TPA: hypothetical protein [Caudoviricetes sp.]
MHSYLLFDKFPYTRRTSAGFFCPSVRAVKRLFRFAKPV